MDVGDLLQALVVHYKIIHMLKPDSAYTCLENNCSQTFNCLSSFKRHFNRKHLTFNTVTQNAVSNDVLMTNENNFNNHIQTPHSVEEPQHEHRIDDETQGIFNFENATNLVYESTVKFIISLYNNNNFNKSDVHYIQSGIKENILMPLASILKNTVKKNIKEPTLRSTFNEIESLILDPFTYCSTEYHLNNWLMKNKLLSNVHQITINNELCAINHNGEICYNERVTKGALLPLKHQFKQFFENGNNFKIIYEQILKFQNISTTLLNFTQGKLWEKKNLSLKER